MIRVTLTDPAVFEHLRKCYSNREKNVASVGARRAVNAARKRFFESAKLTAKIHGDPCMVDNVAAIYYMALPRVDWDACVKTLQDGLQDIVLGCKDDRVIRYAWCMVVRPHKGTKTKPERPREIVAEFYDAEEERMDILVRVEELLKFGTECWKK
jgi:hypothetical protein